MSFTKDDEEREQFRLFTELNDELQKELDDYFPSMKKINIILNKMIEVLE